MGAFTYPRSEPGSAGHMDLVQQLNATAGRLERELGGLPESTLTRRPADDSWSIKETLGHLCDVGAILHERLYMMIKLEEPRLRPYDGHELAQQRNAQETSVEDLLREFSEQRAKTVEVLGDLVHWNWARPGRHPTLGRLSIRQQVDHWIAHEAEHLAQIDRLKQEAAA
jgi:uncharacterized damage-inducible protein DinB